VIPPQARRGRVTLNLYDQLSAYIPKRGHGGASTIR